MACTPPLAPPPAAHIPLSSFPAATAPEAQGVSSAPTSPYSSRPPSPSRPDARDAEASYPPSMSFSRSTSYSPSASRTPSRSRDPLFKKQSSPRRNRALVAWLRGLLDSTEEQRGRSQPALSTMAEEPNGYRERWTPSRERAQLILAFCMIGLVGMNDSATGANLNSMQAYYGVSYDQISIVFLSNVAGYFISCVSSSFLTHALGLRWSLFLAAVNMSLGCITLALAPPYPVFVFALALLGFGGGLYDASLTTVISHEEDGVLMSCMYACFGVGAMFSPIIIGSFIDHGLPWNRYYYMPLAITIFLGILAFPIFSTYEAPKDEVPASSLDVEGEVVHARAHLSTATRMRRALRLKAVWAGFLLIVLAFGTSDTLSAWIVSFMVEKRQSPEAVSRYQLSGMWGGIAVGRVVLAVLGRKMGERSFSVLMLGLASSCLALIWAVKIVAVDAVALVFTGFFIGPVTPAVLSTVSRRVPPSLKSSVMSLTIGLGLIGSSVGPLLFGVVAGKGYLASLPAVLIGASVIASGAWLLVPKNVRRED